jgi:hypothetical protein
MPAKPLLYACKAAHTYAPLSLQRPKVNALLCPYMHRVSDALCLYRGLKVSAALCLCSSCSMPMQPLLYAYAASVLCLCSLCSMPMQPLLYAYTAAYTASTAASTACLCLPIQPLFYAYTASVPQLLQTERQSRQ